MVTATGFVDSSPENAAGRIFSEHGAAEVTRSIIRDLNDLHSRGFYHNDVRVDNVVFGSGGPVLRESTKATEVEESLPPLDFAMVSFCPEEVAYLYLGGRRRRSLVCEGEIQYLTEIDLDDSQLLDLIDQDSPELSLIRVGIRSARILGRLVPGPQNREFNVSEGRFASSFSMEDVLEELYTNVIAPQLAWMDKARFMRIMTEPTHDSDYVAIVDEHMNFNIEITEYMQPVRDVILGVRQLARYMAAYRVPRKEFASVVLLFLELQGASSYEGFWELMKGPREAISSRAQFYSVAVTDALHMAWDVMHGKQPDYAELDALLPRGPDTVTI